MNSNNKSFNDYLISKTAEKGALFTHTRIGDKTHKVYGGSYSITDNKKFIDAYYKHVFVNGQKVGAMSANEWRETFPKIAQAVETIVWDYN